MGCYSSSSQLEKESPLDVQYKVGAIYTKSLQENAASFIYRGIFKRITASRCNWFPSDSAYVLLASKRCNPIVGTISGVGRFMTEVDAPLFKYPLLQINNHLAFVDFGVVCEN